MPEVSIIVATYNADWQKLMMTINSIIIQSIDYYEIYLTILIITVRRSGIQVIQNLKK